LKISFAVSQAGPSTYLLSDVQVSLRQFLVIVTIEGPRRTCTDWRHILICRKKVLQRSCCYQRETYRVVKDTEVMSLVRSRGDIVPQGLIIIGTTGNAGECVI
jgi:hypothetical protein